MPGFIQYLRRLLRPEPQLDSPLILLGKGGGGSRLLSQMALDCGVSMGTRLNRSLDSLDMAAAVYRSVERKLGERKDRSPALIESDLRCSARTILHSIHNEGRASWAFKLPECLFILPELRSAFPHARYAVLIRDPLDTATRRSHQTARIESHIGGFTLPAAYRHCGLDPANLAADPIPLHNACATAHQLDLLMDHLDILAARKKPAFVTRFEDVIRDPQCELAAFSRWLGRPVTGRGLSDSVNQDRASAATECPPEVLDQIERILQPVRKRIEGLPTR